MHKDPIAHAVTSIVSFLILSMACSCGSVHEAQDISRKPPEALIEQKGDIYIWSISKLEKSSQSRQAFIDSVPKGFSDDIDIFKETINVSGVNWLLEQEDSGWKLVYNREVGTQIITPDGDHIRNFEKGYLPIRILVNPNNHDECFIGAGQESDSSAVTGLYKLSISQKSPVPIKKFNDGSFGSLYYDQKHKMVVMVGTDYSNHRGFFLKQNGSIGYMPEKNMSAYYVGVKGTYGAVIGKGYHIPGLFDGHFNFVAYQDIPLLKDLGLNLKNVEIKALRSDNGADTILFFSRSKKVANPRGVYVVWVNR